MSLPSEAQDFSVPPPPEIGKPRSPAAAVTFLSEVEAASTDIKHEVTMEAWAVGSSGFEARQCQASEVIELLLSSLALTCWTAMCVLDLSGYWNVPFEDEDSLASEVLSLGVWCVACVVFIARQCALCRRKDVWSKDLEQCHANSPVSGAQFQYELLMLLATQWSLISGAVAWLVFHAANQRRQQVVAGLLAILVLLILLLCTVVHFLRERRQRSKVSPSRTASPTGQVEPHVDTRRNASSGGPHHANAPQDGLQAFELSSMTSSVVLSADLNRLSFKSHRSSARSSGGTRDQEDSLSMSGNYLGKLWSDDGSVSKQSVLKQGVDSMDSEVFSVTRLMSDKSLKQVVFDEIPVRSSRGRWRPLFPSLAAESLYSPSASMSCSVASVRRLGSQKFIFESEEDAQRSLAQDIKSHGQHLAVRTAPQLDRSPSPSLSMKSQNSHLSLPDPAKENFRRPSTNSSAMSDVSDSRSKQSPGSSFGS